MMKQQEITEMSVADIQDQIANRSEQLVKMKLAHSVFANGKPFADQNASSFNCKIENRINKNVRLKLRLVHRN